MEVSRYLDLFVDIGQAMLEAGAGIHRVEDTIYRLCGAYGLGRADIFAIRSLILVTIREDTGKSYTDSRRIYGIGTNMARLEELLRQKQGFAFCMLDLDHLKAVNDTLGHHAGDNYIRSVIAELQKIVRFSDIIGRIGGDEFSVILPDCSESSAEEKMLLLNERLRAGKEIYPMSVSYGVIYVEPEQKLSAETVMARADGKMYQSKKSKK